MLNGSKKIIKYAQNQNPSNGYVETCTNYGNVKLLSYLTLSEMTKCTLKRGLNYRSNFVFYTHRNGDMRARAG